MIYSINLVLTKSAILSLLSIFAFIIPAQKCALWDTEPTSTRNVHFIKLINLSIIKVMFKLHMHMSYDKLFFTSP